MTRSWAFVAGSSWTQEGSQFWRGHRAVSAADVPAEALEALRANAQEDEPPRRQRVARPEFTTGELAYVRGRSCVGKPRNRRLFLSQTGAYVGAAQFVEECAAALGWHGTRRTLYGKLGRLALAAGRLKAEYTQGGGWGQSAADYHVPLDMVGAEDELL